MLLGDKAPFSVKHLPPEYFAKETQFFERKMTAKKMVIKWNY